MLSDNHAPLAFRERNTLLLNDSHFDLLSTANGMSFAMAARSLAGILRRLPGGMRSRITESVIDTPPRFLAMAAPSFIRILQE